MTFKWQTDFLPSAALGTSTAANELGVTLRALLMLAMQVMKPTGSNATIRAPARSRRREWYGVVEIPVDFHPPLDTRNRVRRVSSTQVAQGHFVLPFLEPRKWPAP